MIKADDGVQNFKTQLKILLFSKGVYLTVWTINICPLTILVCGKGTISNIIIMYKIYNFNPERENE